jgi:hypothetical protein
MRTISNHAASNSHRSGSSIAVTEATDPVCRERRGWAALFLAALLLQIPAQNLEATIEVVNRVSRAEAQCAIDNESKIATPKEQTDFLPANLSNSVTFSLNGVSATANSTSISAIFSTPASNDGVFCSCSPPIAGLKSTAPASFFSYPPRANDQKGKQNLCHPLRRKGLGPSID